MTFECSSCQITHGKNILPFTLQGRAVCHECYFSTVNKWDESLRQEASLLLRSYSDSALEIPTLKREYSWGTIINLVIKFFSRKERTEKDNIV